MYIPVQKFQGMYLDKLIIADIHFIYIFELISISTPLWNDKEWIN